ncbi:LAME_0F12838g1_1 [Lachancea meyersii CBS 8951]|uniref:LAME_0F12838g1_1 n=1 Tax=Lachancea meyersii CBS 8951 TaxID=1266667 RepID=A0A1G4JX44_9SACH|nr:LAME_0F12838g1_1 [Lachancea meyersii CBS 8951]
MVKTVQHTINNPLGSAVQVLVSKPENDVNSPNSPISMVISTATNPASNSLICYVYAVPTSRDVLSTVLTDTIDDRIRETAVRISKLCAKKSQRPFYLTMAGDAGSMQMDVDQLLLCKECVSLIENDMNA